MKCRRLRPAAEQIKLFQNNQLLVGTIAALSLVRGPLPAAQETSP
ncbi:hypothetical protein XACM_0212 [Xanthomonas euvesicatoria pv. citrumelo F1]|nr:hypothetical protein XACM_0212 [Xanthomonas euvesicatoria pv. citrumelo F1]